MIEFACVRRHANAATCHCQRVTCGYQVDMVLLRHYTVVREHHWKNRSVGKSFSQQPLAPRIEMLNDNNKGRTVVSRQSGQQFGKIVVRIPE